MGQRYFEGCVIVIDDNTLVWNVQQVYYKSVEYTSEQSVDIKPQDYYDPQYGRYAVTQLLHGYLHRCNSTAPIEVSLLLTCSTYTATLLESMCGYSKVTLEPLQRSNTTSTISV